MRELFLAMLIGKLRNTPTWMGQLKDESSFVGNNVIHLNAIGADPTVLINNSVYPIATAQREDTDIPLALNKYDTTNTRISQDELYAIPYDKPGSVIEQHKGVLDEQMGAHGLYTIAPQAATAAMPILVTTGANDGTGRLRMTPEDLIRLSNAFDNAKIPKQGRILVLSNEHVMDLQISTLGSYIAAMFQNIGTGTLAPTLYGFQLHQDLYAPVYNLTTKTRKAFGAATAGTDSTGSVAFYAPDAFRALGTAQMFYRAADLDPETRSSVAGFQVYGVCAPYTRRSQAAIISGKV
ncbi:hypothetical protein SAMN02745146_0090 [Hymenobacter daecheongensis DSM 21074]|uniref:Phage major capsid protein, HK97 family n=1 Tax=Hymenobacter daecheongensis DSM 21074 TaxID=1121955 RepID=A0A1M6LX43_9BACT|nr:hypothetical protein [Hymenobacter daecheongensis]SHJ75837.1 hypothetical protein SAMN02745146_0090 [Hymenobacter daecheongensis DSM 21074]